MHNEVLEATKLVVRNSNFISLTYNEDATMDITSWGNCAWLHCARLVLHTIIIECVAIVFWI
jgi:hypothetical protein